MLPGFNEAGKKLDHLSKLVKMVSIVHTAFIASLTFLSNMEAPMMSKSTSKQ